MIAGRLIFNELRKEKMASVPVFKKEIPEDLPEPSPSNQHKSFERSDDLIPKTFQGDSGVLECDIEALPLTKLESLLKEKNNEIDHFKNLLEIEQKNKIEYEKIKDLLQRQIFESRQMNKEVQRELKSLQAQTEILDAQANKLRSDLIYKDQLLLKKDYELAELNAALHGHILVDNSDPLVKKPTNSSDLSDSNRDLGWTNTN